MGGCGCTLLLKICGVAKVVFFFTRLYFTSQQCTYRRDRKELVPSPDPDLCLLLSDYVSFIESSSPVLCSIVGNISHYNGGGNTGCYLGALYCVFVGHWSCFWETDREQAKGLFPSVCPCCRDTGVQPIDHCAPGGRTDSVGGMGEQRKTCLIWICMNLMHVRCLCCFLTNFYAGMCVWRSRAR